MRAETELHGLFIESRIVLELQSARGIRSAYGSIGT